MPGETAQAICCMIFGGVLERHPNLKVCFAHGGKKNNINENLILFFFQNWVLAGGLSDPQMNTEWSIILSSGKKHLPGLVYFFTQGKLFTDWVG